ncbi:MAG: hypothetical protein LJE61_02980 [Thiocapsa sp.]|jgi:nitric oxide reductase activation protein|nr:hypothetical protein [Thiocapsa sp.]MCG6984154.1 hypothetical protein [Thiocapsa sp.]
MSDDRCIGIELGREESLARVRTVRRAPDELAERDGQAGRLFQRRRKLERDLAVLFTLDIGGWTKGWINDVQRASLVLLCEALERLGDRYAILGFSGYRLVDSVPKLPDRVSDIVRRIAA